MNSTELHSELNRMFAELTESDQEKTVEFVRGLHRERGKVPVTGKGEPARNSAFSEG